MVRSDFTIRLMRWYRKNNRDLPWRQTRDPYKIWISEVMLQQTTVATVIPYYKRWVETFPRIKSVARASLTKVLKMWQGLGYYQRVKNIHRAAKILNKSFDCKIPKSFEVLSKLPGFGPYTTGAVLSIAYDLRHPIIDANVRRVCMRLLAIKGISHIKKDDKIYAFLDKVLPEKEVGIFNQALMELGALICHSSGPLCLACPVKGFCLVYKKGWQDIIPAPHKKTFLKIEAVAGIIENKGLYFIQKRPSKGLLANLWEFPGGKIERGERTQEAIARELKEEIGASLISVKPFMTVKHAYTKFQVRLHVFRCQVQPLPQADKTHKWVSLLEFKKYPIPSATSVIVETLKKSQINT